MAVTEHDRHRMYQRLEEVLGPEEATTLMEHLPPVGWADVATKRDIDDLRAATKHGFDDLRTATEHLGTTLRLEMESQGHQFRAELYRALRQQLIAVVAANTALAGIVVAAVKLA